MLLNLPINNEIKIWQFSKELPLQPISSKELKWKKYLSSYNFQRYHFSRGYVRYALSKIFKIPALEIPLNAKPGKPPILENNLGYLSLSHSKNAIIIGWAPRPIGIDFENKKRNFAAKKIHDKFYFDSEKKDLLNSKHKFKEDVLKYWIIKEASFKWQVKKENIDLFHWEWKKDQNFALNKKINKEVKTYILNYQSYFIGIAYI